ncbi:MAG: L,D-transpeptidase family protein [Endomicrobium sp.]|jgi:murein L,D-transpeptidase YafK|nr:L,D-transpeptidase family protein [Endomicrobium sp.]
MKKIALVLCIAAAMFSCGLARAMKKDFLSLQKEYPRVRKAFADKSGFIDKTLAAKKISAENLNILIIAYKAEAELEVYAKNSDEDVYKSIAVYAIVSSSGKLGPKRRQGDMQVPEGFYSIDRFNPASSFYLSLGINYPNKSDKKKSSALNLGGDIFIHGSNVTIGCIPVTDDKIKEIYVLSAYAKNAGQSEIPVYIFPFKMSDANMEKYKALYLKEPKLISFWENLKTGYDKFTQTARELKFSIDASGTYIF